MTNDNHPASEYQQVLQSIAAQLMNGPNVSVGDETLRVKRVSSGRLRTVRVTINGREIRAIEQNPEKPSRWGKLARKGHEVVQFQDLLTRKYLAVVVDGKLIEYGR